jgi:hypothetical protein
MNRKSTNMLGFGLVFLGLSGISLATSTESDELGPIYDLEAFIVRESAAYISGGLTPSSRAVSGVFSADFAAVDMPRSVTLLTPEHMEVLQIKDLRSLSKVGAGTQLINHYGVTGTPIIRGAKGATLLNGMVRSFNLNEMPLSFGSSEAVDIVKGPTPPHLSPTHVGGFVNLLPKQPFFDKTRGAVSLSVRSYDQTRLSLDYGGPSMVFGLPSAFRVSLTAQRESGYYDRLRNDYESAYVAFKTDLNPKVTLFAGTEFFHYRSNENAGWNRVTQNLIDNSQYVIGEPINIVDPEFQNTANRDLVSYPLGYGWYNGIADFNALVVPTSVVNEAVESGRISQQARLAMLDLSNPDDRARAYGQPLPSTGVHDPNYRAIAAVGPTLARLSQNANEGFRYTREYFDQGGVVFTEAIGGNQILADENDDAEAFNWVGFSDFYWSSSADTFWQSKFIFDGLKTEKLSSYGYAIQTEQLVIANRTEGLSEWDIGSGASVTYGISTRYTYSEMVQDYFAEPFARRDISRAAVSQNSRILAGPQVGPDGLNYWSPDIGANVSSDLFQAALYSQLDYQPNERLRLLVTGRAEYAWYQAELPQDVQRASDAVRDGIENQGSKPLYSVGAYVTYRVTDGINLYSAAQEGVALDLTQAGGVYGDENFAAAGLVEGGVKWSLMDDRIQGAFSVWTWDQSRFNQRDFQSEPLEGEGVEFELSAEILRERLFFIFSTENQQIRRKTELGFRTIPQSEVDWALGAGALNGGVIATPENNPEREYPGFPETTYKGHLIWKQGKWQASVSGIYSRSYWLNFEHSMRLPRAFVLNARTGWKGQRWQVFVHADNLTGEDAFLGSDPLFASNTLVTKGTPTLWGLEVTRRF